MKKLVLLALPALVGMTAAAAATEVTESIEINAAPEKVWAASAKDFCGIGQFHPAVELSLIHHLRAHET